MKKKIIAQICFCAVLLPLLIAGCGGSGGGTDESGGGGPTPQNQAPVAEDGTLAVTENQAASGTLEATDADGDALVFSIVGQPAHGSVAINDTTAGTYLYTPAPDYTGPDGFTFKANDGQADSNTASISITVEPASAPPPTTVNVALTVKEVAGVGASHYPVVAVVPLRYGTYYEADLAGFHVVDAAGDTVPSQIGIHNLWWARDRSIRMLDVHFEPTVGAYTAADTGISKYYFVYDTGLADPATPLTVQNVNGTVTVVTGPLKFITGKNPFHILDKVWLDKNGDGNFSDDELLLDAAGAGGGVLKNRFDNLERDALRNDVTVEVEEAGPIRVVLKAESPSRFTNISDMRSGFAVRIYAYAGKPFIRIDYQLQNAALNSAKSWPLYFKSLNLDFPLKPGNDPTVRIGLGAGDVYETAAGAPVVLQQRYLPNGGDQGEFQFKVVKDGSDVASGAQAPGYLDVTGSRGGVTAVTRFFWQMWPNGLRFDPASGTMQVQLFPAWGKMWVQRVNDPAPHFTQSGLYWLQDMQAVYKQVLLDFHGSSAPSNERLHALAATFNHAPVPIIPTSWYAATHVTLDMYGLIPYTTQQGTGGSRKDDYTAHNPFAYNDAAGINYNFGWDQFLANVTRKWGSENAGGWPHAVARDIILTGNPAAWYYAGEFAMGELNMHPQWMPGYSYEEDYERVPVTPTAKYNETSWRQTGGLAAPPLEGTRSRTSRPRGDEHGWFYQIAQAYNFNDNPWIEDWYGFIGEMRLARLHNRYPQDSTDRGRGHAFSNALQAFRVTGDMDIIHQSQWFVQLLRSWQSRRYGAMHGGYAKSGQIGFLARALISYMAEVQGYNREGWAQAFQCLSGIIVWNLVYGNFGYAVDAAAGEHGQSAITGQNMANPQAWYYLHTGRDTFRQQILAYIDTGINGGCAAKDCARGVGDWGKDGKGGFVGRTSTYVYHHEKADLTPPAKIADLSAERIGDGNVKVSFTVPTGNARRYHFVYARKPISATYTAEEAKMNWWAAHVQAPEITADPGQTASFVFHTNIADPFYMAMFSFDDHDTLSEMSNLYDLAQGIRNGDGLIPPWQFDNVGSPPPSGSVSYGVNSNVYDLGTYTIESNGSFHGDTGEFAFVHQDAGGNQAIAFRVTSATYFTRVGPMFRESLTSASRFVALFYTGSHDLRLVYRSDTGGDKTTFYLGEAQEPVYLKLVRDGDTYTAYASPDGIDWGDALKSVTVSTLPADVQAGVAAGSSSVDGQAYPAQAKVDHLAVAGS